MVRKNRECIYLLSRNNGLCSSDSIMGAYASKRSAIERAQRLQHAKESEFIDYTDIVSKWDVGVEHYGYEDYGHKIQYVIKRMRVLGKEEEC